MRSSTFINSHKNCSKTKSTICLPSKRKSKGSKNLSKDLRANWRSLGAGLAILRASLRGGGTSTKGLNMKMRDLPNKLLSSPSKSKLSVRRLLFVLSIISNFKKLMRSSNKLATLIKRKIKDFNKI